MVLSAAQPLSEEVTARAVIRLTDRTDPDQPPDMFAASLQPGVDLDLTSRLALDTELTLQRAGALDLTTAGLHVESRLRDWTASPSTRG